MNKIGIGLVTYERPKYFDQSSKAIVRTLLGYVDRLVIYNDGSTKDYSKAYKWLEGMDKVTIIHNKENHGVAHAKNQLFKELMKDCEYLFISEDDMIPQDRRAITMYMAAHKMTGVDHMMFAHHGWANAPAEALVDIKGPLEYYHSCVGAWCFYTRDVLKKVGLMDEKFYNAWEHVEHTWRIFKYHELEYGYYPDVIDSREFIKEIPGSIDNSSIGLQNNAPRIKVIIDGLRYWKKKDKDFPAQHTLDFFINLKKEMEKK